MIESDLPASFAGHYTFTRDDYLALVQATQRPRQGVRTILVTAWISLFVLIMGLMSENWSQFVQAMQDLVTFNDVPFFIYGVFLTGFVLIALMPNLTLLRAMRLYRTFAIADQHIVLTLDEAGVITSAPGRQSRLEWPFIRRVVVRPDHLFLAISEREAVVVPRRAFANEFEFAAVKALARRKVPPVGPK